MVSVIARYLVALENGLIAEISYNDEKHLVGETYLSSGLTGLVSTY